MAYNLAVTLLSNQNARETSIEFDPIRCKVEPDRCALGGYAGPQNLPGFRTSLDKPKPCR